MQFEIFLFASLFVSVRMQETTAMPCQEGCSCNATTVDCSGIQLRNFPTTIPPTIEVLLLNNNRMFTVAVDALAGFQQLTTVNLDDNKLSQLTLQIPPSLTKITANNNRIRSVSITSSTSDEVELKELQLDENSFRAIPTLPPSVENLHIKGNNIDSISNSDFIGHENIKELYLIDSRIKDFPNNTFDRMDNLEVLDISLNTHTELHYEWFVNKPKLRVVSVRTFTLNCDCELLRAYDKLRELNLDSDDLSEVNCYTPEALHNQLVEDVIQNHNITGCDFFVTTTSPTTAAVPMMPINFHNPGVVAAIVITMILVIAIIGCVVALLIMKGKSYASI